MEVFPLRPSAYLCVLCVDGPFNAENAEIRRGPQRKQIRFATFCAKPDRPVSIQREYTALLKLAEQYLKQPGGALGMYFEYKEYRALSQVASSPLFI